MGRAESAGIPAARPQEDALRFALAINRGMQLLDSDPRRQTPAGKDLADKFNGLFVSETAQVKEIVNDLYVSIHQELFRDWKAQPHLHPDSEIVGERDRVAAAIHDLLLKGRKSLREEGQFARSLSREDLAAKLATFYKRLSQAKPFPYGNRLTLEFFLTALLNQPNFRQVSGYEGGLDFRRLNEEERADLRNPETSVEALTDLFLTATDRNIFPPVPENTDRGFYKWPRKEIVLNGAVFLGHWKDKKHYVVTIDGGLVDRKTARKLYEEFRKEDKPIADFTIPPEHIAGYLGGTEALRHPGKRHIDGIALPEDGSRPLFCLETDILTGLRHDRKAFMKLYKTIFRKIHPDKEFSIFTLADNEALYQALCDATQEGSRMRRVVEIAYRNVSQVVSAMNDAKEGIFAGKTPVNDPVFHMSMGGASAGKSSVEKLVEAECGSNYIVASLDEFRNKSDLYTVLRAADHHADDYKVVESMANNLRDWVKEHALHGRYNLLLDGTGISYKNRYDWHVHEAKKLGYRTRLGAVDAPMEVVADRIVERFHKKKRALPWTVVTGKHADFPFSLLPALDDFNLDKITLFANDTPLGKRERCLIGESFVLPEEEVAALRAARHSNTLAEKFAVLMEDEGKGAVLPMLKKVDDPELHARRYPELSEDNVSFFIHPQDERRVFAIYDVGRLTDLVRKAQINRHANSPGGLGILPENAKFMVSNASAGNGVFR